MSQVQFASEGWMKKIQEKEREKERELAEKFAADLSTALDKRDQENVRSIRESAAEMHRLKEELAAIYNNAASALKKGGDAAKSVPMYRKVCPLYVICPILCPIYAIRAALIDHVSQGMSLICHISHIRQGACHPSGAHRSRYAGRSHDSHKPWVCITGGWPTRRGRHLFR